MSQTTGSSPKVNLAKEVLNFKFNRDATKSFHEKERIDYLNRKFLQHDSVGINYTENNSSYLRKEAANR